MKKLIEKFIKDESGMETLEWALVGAFGPKIEAVFTKMGGELEDAIKE